MDGINCVNTFSYTHSIPFPRYKFATKLKQVLLVASGSLSSPGLQTFPSCKMAIRQWRTPDEGVEKSFGLTHTHPFEAMLKTMLRYSTVSWNMSTYGSERRGHTWAWVEAACGSPLRHQRPWVTVIAWPHTHKDSRGKLEDWGHGLIVVGSMRSWGACTSQDVSRHVSRPVWRLVLTPVLITSF